MLLKIVDQNKLEWVLNTYYSFSPFICCWTVNLSDCQHTNAVNTTLNEFTYGFWSSWYCTSVIRALIALLLLLLFTQLNILSVRQYLKYSFWPRTLWTVGVGWMKRVAQHKISLSSFCMATKRHQSGWMHCFPCSSQREHFLLSRCRVKLLPWPLRPPRPTSLRRLTLHHNSPRTVKSSARTTCEQNSQTESLQCTTEKT